MVMAQSLCISLRERDPSLVIDVLGPRWSLPVVERMPEVREAIESPFGHGELDWRGRRRLGHALRERGYGRAIVLPRSAKAALVPFHAAIPRRTAYRTEMRYFLVNDLRKLDRGLLPTTVQRYVALGLPRGAPLPPAVVPPPALRTDAGNTGRALERLALAAPESLVGMMPGAEYGPAKQWPAERFAGLAARLLADGAAVWVFGSGKDRDAGDRIVAGAPGAVNLCGRTSLADVVDLLALCRVTVTNDSGLMHVAAATGSHVVAIYGSSSPGYTPPLTSTATILREPLECSPCFARTCRYGHYRCLASIDVDRAGAAVRAALAGAGPRGDGCSVVGAASGGGDRDLGGGAGHIASP